MKAATSERAHRTLLENGWPVVTAIVPTHDRPELLARAIRSVLAQDYPGRIEILIVFDQRDPQAPDVGEASDRDLVLSTNERSPGLAGSRNTGALAASGELLAFLDDDDEWLPSKLRLQVEALRSHPEASLATCGIYVINGQREIVRSPPGPRVTLDHLTRSRRMEVHSSTLVMRRDRLLDDIGLVDEDIPGSYGEDYDLLLRAAKFAPIVAVPEPLARVHWAGSFFADRWGTIVPALEYQLAKHPELTRDPRNLSRMYGRIAFAYAASGDKEKARRWARDSVRLDPRQPRGYLAYAVASGIVRPAWVIKAVNATGRGV
ncbi:MAG: glycosyltransferase family A protein [Actinomycetota bacterium]